MLKANLNATIAVCVLIMALAGPAGAVTYYVDPNGFKDFMTIWEAINAANDYDEIEVAPGTYYENNIDFSGRAVKLYSREGPDVTIIDGMMSWHVVQCISGEGPNTILEGFTITGGFALVNGGGGMYNYYSSPTVNDCNFTWNVSDSDGGGMYNEGGSPTVTNCKFYFNGMLGDGNGGGMYNNGSSPTVTNCTFKFNDAGLGMGDGGGMYNVNSSSPTVTNCTFRENFGSDGGGMCNKNSSSPAVTNCTFSGNLAEGGGGIFNDNSSPTLTNCTFSGNRGDGGGIFNWSSSPTVTNCIFWGYVGDEIFDDGGSSTTVSYSNVKGGWGGAGDNNIDANPVFYAPATGDLRLGACSPSVDAGSNAAVGVSTDLGGNPRLADDANVPDTGSGTPPIVDMGAYERQASSVVWGTISVPNDFNSIQEAINEAYTGDQVIVAPGTYNETIDFKGKAITLRSSDPNDPNIVAATVIDGTGYFHYHVVQCASYEDANTILEGFTITGGNATNGGGMYCENSSPTVTNCILSGNSASGFFSGGGGMYCENSNPMVTNCTFSGNSAFSSGGGMVNRVSSNPTITNCTFNDNSADWGGGMQNYSSSPIVTNCKFTRNTATTGGGGGISNDGSSPDVNDCMFIGNFAGDRGGGMSNIDASSPTVVNCTFAGNLAKYGGGMRNYFSSPTVTNCTFIRNSATDANGDGGGISSDGSSPTVTNCLFYNNSAGDKGGGMSNDSSSPTVTNCTFSGNDANTSGGGMLNINSSPTVTNCILWGDTPNEVNDVNSSTTVTYSDVDGGTGQSWFGTGCIDADPLFVAADEGDLRLSDCSPCSDAGNNAAAPPDTTDLDGDDNTTEPIPFDLDGYPRFVQDPNVPDTGSGTPPIIDMGACERQLDTPGFKIRNITRGKNYCSIQDAIEDANNGDEIEARPTTYHESINFMGKAVRLYSSGEPEATTINGDGAYHTVQCVSGEGPSTILEGFTITGGNANGPDPNDKCGGGMYCESSSPTVTNCIFTDNSATDYGGGMCNIDSSNPTVTDCNFSDNTATNSGGGMYNESSNPTVTNCIFTGNEATNDDGGGMYNDDSSPTVTNCIFSGNEATNDDGGGMCNEGNSSPTVTNCSFSGNSASSGGGGMYNNASDPTVTNCILWGNTASVDPEIYGSATVSYSDIQGGYGGTGNIDADPLFDENLRLSPDSPCIDAGNNAVPYLPDTDLAGSRRIEDGDRDGKLVIDMGALELKVAYEITVLTYNTHLFGDSIVADLCWALDLLDWDWVGDWFDSLPFCMDEIYHEDDARRYRIADKVEESGADIVALQEVWAWSNQKWFVNRLKDTYPFAFIKYSGRDSYLFGIDTLGNGLVLLSKFPLSDTGFKRFPVYTDNPNPGNDDCWANKGVLTATVDIGFQQVRVGISHALTGGDDQKGRWSASYNGNNITTFDLNGRPNIFALKGERWWYPHIDYNKAYLARIDDYSDYNEQDPNQSTYGAGWVHSPCGYCSNCSRQWDSDYLAVVSFELNGHPYLFGLKSGWDQAFITKINENPFLCWEVYGPWSTPWGTNYSGATIKSFQLNGEPYIFGQKSNSVWARIARITSPLGFDDLGLFECGSQYSAVVSFELNGHPYLFGLAPDANQAWISRINDNPSTGWTDVYHGYWPREYLRGAITSFQLNGHPYIFGLESSNNDQAWITRINDDPTTGWTDVYCGPWDHRYVAIKSFEMNGHPYLFGLKNCCQEVLDQCLDWRPGEAYLTRINDDPCTGWLHVYQMEDIQIIRDRTVGEDDMPAIMMGDLNVHRSKYGVMDNIFEKAGAVDAYIQVHGTGAGGETIDLGNNKLHQVFSGKDPCDPCDYPTEGTFDRIDYVYVQPSGTGFELVPTEAHVIRDWKYDDVWCDVNDRDLSDHYPLMVKFQIRRLVDFNDDSKIDFNDFAMLASAWLAESGDPLWDVKYNLNIPPDDVINMRDFAVFVESWLADF